MRMRKALTAEILIPAVLSLGACNQAGPRDDKTITEEIQSKLYQDATLKTRDISVIAQNGVVILSGQVNSEKERAAAEHLAAAVEGVKQVINQLVVVGPCPVGAPTAPQPAAPEQVKSSADTWTAQCPETCS